MEDGHDIQLSGWNTMQHVLHCSQQSPFMKYQRYAAVEVTDWDLGQSQSMAVIATMSHGTGR